MTCWIACCVVASAGAPAAAVACTRAAVACAAGAVEVEGRDNAPLVSRLTAKMMMAISASARMTVTTIPPIARRSFGGGLAVWKLETLLGSVLLIAPQDFRSGQRRFERTRRRALHLAHQVVIVERFLNDAGRVV